MATSPAYVTMTEIVCGECGMRFQITHRASASDAALAERQAAWLADQFVWDHIQDNKHRGSIDLPYLPSGGVKGCS